MYNDMNRSTQTTVESMLSEINTQIPGTIVSYDAATNRAVVKPDLPKRIASDEKLESPNIVEVPVVWAASGGGKSTFTMPLQPGDGVMLAFQQRSMEGWLSGSKEMPDDPRQFDLSDCVAIPGCQSSGIVGHAEDVLLKFNKTEVRIKPDNTIIVGNDKGTLTIDSAGNIMLHADGNITFGNDKGNLFMDPAGNLTVTAQTINIVTPAKSFVLETHRHPGVQTGSSNTSTPI